MRKFRIKKFIVFLLTVCIIFNFQSVTYGKASTTDNSEQSGNNYPIIMVHGLFGWGNNELADINYWGGSKSLRQELTEKGYTVYTPSVGPISSNWDRACELYAYIKGGTVDYGEVHSKEFGHARYGRTYPGVYSEFGTEDNSGNIKKIHLIGHSMGGQTIRVLVQLLENGSADETAATTDGSISPLFTGGKSWVSSVTTIATPHNGSQEAYSQYKLEPFAHDIFAALAAETGADLTSSDLNLDLKMDQWGLKRETGETYLSYYNKVMNSNLWNKTKDLSLWDLTPEGAKELNESVQAQKDVYYFSIACSDTHESVLTHFQIPNSNMNAVLLKSSLFMGMFTNNTIGEVTIDKSWWENDGVVSVISAVCPTVGSSDQMINYDGSPQIGEWNYLGKIDNVDHLEVVQMKNNRSTLEEQYFNLAEQLANLPN